MAVFDIFANMAIDAAGGGRDVFGSRPDVAAFVPTDLGAETKRAAEANIQNVPEIQALLEKLLPGYGAMIAQGSKNTMSLLRGEVPQDVQDKLRRNSAYKAFSGGYGGSNMSKALTARDLGLTSLDMMERGGNSAQRWAGLTQAGAAPWMITGSAQAENQWRNNLYRQATEQHRMNVAASPDPAAAGLFNTISAIGSTAASFGMGAMMSSMSAPAPAPKSPTPASPGLTAPYWASGVYNNMQPGQTWQQNATWGSYGGG